ncbi:hypothetical protein [Natronobacterium texcoconense]|uniref:Uncharacterized protein n=1 Tax=Natronobacterium texcoconense TaxID=1095778 RepID=A0A1H1C1L7_NATTX|nr:hypothetical protein [Natronobacterium texcoconense]SDQ57910.1 hypothetical protein SAMN04489842_1228 [Natronobacterium texcoconense]
MPSRRRVLTLLAASPLGVLAGCATPGGALTMRAVETDTAIGVEATETVDANRNPEIATLLDDTLKSDSVEVEGKRPPFDPDRSVRWKEGVYGVSWEVTGERTRTDYVVAAEPVDEDADRARIAYEDLPATDRSKLAGFREELAQANDEPRIGVRLEYVDEDAIEASTLVPESEYDLLVVDDHLVSIEARETETTVHTFTYELEKRATSTAAYGAKLRANRLVTLEPSSDEQRDLIEEAVTDGRAVVGIDDDAFVAVGEQLLTEEPIYVSGREGTWLVEYEDTIYWTELDALRTTELVDRLEEYDTERDRGFSSNN